MVESTVQKSINFGDIDNYILFGGDFLLFHMLPMLCELQIPLFVVTSERHAFDKFEYKSSLITLAELLEKKKIEYIVAKNLDDERIKDKIHKNTLGLSSSAAWIFRKPFIDLFEGRLLNFHNARLPQNRGAGGFSWRILANDRLGASLIHQIEPGVDDGDIVFYDEYVFPAECRIPIDYYNYSTKQYIDNIKIFLTAVHNKQSFSVIQQQEALSTYWPRLATDINGYIDWSWSVENVEKFICAFDDPYAGASTFIKDNKVRLKKCYVLTSDGVFHPFQTGIIYRLNKTGVFIAAEQGALLVQTVLNEDGNDIQETLRVGDRFYTPVHHLEQAKRSRVIFTAKGLKLNTNR